MEAPISTVFNEDCQPGLKGYPDDFFDLAVVDPPYGLGFSTYERYGYKGKEHLTGRYAKKDWDNQGVPGEDYFRELFRVSREQIIWGGNYFELPPVGGWLVWYKQQPVPNFADCELAWTSFNRPAKVYDFRYYGLLEGRTLGKGRIHPTQKPVQLYERLFRDFAFSADGVITHRKVLDTHLGSQSSRIAAWRLGLDFWGWEIDPDYFQEGTKRFEEERIVKTLF
jgi:site-specific DNA-methyltransferase (adenine-specific)